MEIGIEIGIEIGTDEKGLWKHKPNVQEKKKNCC